MQGQKLPLVQTAHQQTQHQLSHFILKPKTHEPDTIAN